MHLNAHCELRDFSGASGSWLLGLIKRFRVRDFEKVRPRAGIQVRHHYTSLSELFDVTCRDWLRRNAIHFFVKRLREGELIAEGVLKDTPDKTSRVSISKDYWYCDLMVDPEKGQIYEIDECGPGKEDLRRVLFSVKVFNAGDSAHSGEDSPGKSNREGTDIRKKVCEKLRDLLDKSPKANPAGSRRALTKQFCGSKQNNLNYVKGCTHTIFGEAWEKEIPQKDSSNPEKKHPWRRSSGRPRKSGSS